MLFEEQEVSKLFYSISEVAEMFDVNASLIRFWEKEFDILKPKKNKKGNRLFTKEDLENLKVIYHLVKEKGFTLDGAKQKLKDDRKGVQDNTALIESLQKVKKFLLELKEEI